MKVVEIGRRNIAPSADASEHDIHVFSIAIGSATPFWLEHSLRGGHAERGGCSMLALHEVEGWCGDWRAEMTRAGCAWAIALLEQALRSGDAQAAIEAIVAQVDASA
ncbi:hypothetical protein ACI6Q5_01875 [Xanthomonas codiaei]|uniref:Uncharacterized protein n=1 Tax=Xanthomonas codiaei TaxID=56463 RepID=A0A2S7CUA1_9XANT|nr:hypothetical protein [Xanthomonas codiaei]PPU65168.1 hypothetical protein XcodCFBP4690_06185 [Xanthomonas codiaei]